MKTLSIALATVVLGASLSSAFAEQANPNAALVPAAEATQVGKTVIVEGRQAAAIASNLSDGERFVIDHNVSNR